MTTQKTEVKKDNRGKPRKFKTSKDFYDKFKEYVNYCNDEHRLPNIAGFCVWADINRDTFYDQKAFYFDTYKKIEEMLEDEALNNKFTNDTLKIFYMKNKCGYKDKQEIDNSVKLNNPFENMSTDELRETLGKLENE